MTTVIEISTQKDRLDVDYIHRFISNTYWGKERTPEMTRTCIEHSLNLGVYLGTQQIGYARAVTDYAQFAYIMDVFIDAGHRGKGYSKRLMEYMLNCEELRAVKVWRLATTDAHGLYAQFGFRPLDKPGKLMELML